MSSRKSVAEAGDRNSDVALQMARRSLKQSDATSGLVGSVVS